MVRGWKDYTKPVTIEAVTIETLPIDIKAQTVTELKVDIAAQSIPTLNINLASVGDVTLNVNITGTPTINVQTGGGANIVVDKLTQSAYIDGWTTPGQTPPYYKTGEAYYGKFFPRGCRGMIEGDFMYAKGNGTDTITLAYAPQPGMGPVLTSTFAPGTSWGWCGNALDYFWNYDSCFIYVLACGSSVSFGYDISEPYDGRGSIDSGQTWMKWDARLWVRLVLTMETVGDLPVSGTVNTIEVPTISSQAEGESITVPVGVETTIVSVNGAGSCDMIVCEAVATAYPQYTEFRVYCDDNLALNLQPYVLNALGFTASTPGVSLLRYATSGTCCFVVTKRFNFRRSLVVKAYNGSGAQGVTCYAYPSLIT
jgi:hypothetical protein